MPEQTQKEQEYSNGELGIMLYNLDERVGEGFKGTHKRLDEINSKVAKNTEWRLTSQGSLAIIKWLVGFIGLTTVANIIVNLFK